MSLATRLKKNRKNEAAVKKMVKRIDRNAKVVRILKRGGKLSFEELWKLCPDEVELDPFHQKNIDDIIFQVQHEIDICDEDQDGAPIQSSEQRSKAVRFIELCVRSGGQRVQD